MLSSSSPDAKSLFSSSGSQSKELENFTEKLNKIEDIFSRFGEDVF